MNRPPEVNRHQRAFLKIQDGCDAHCTYCIIPKLRPKLWSKPLEDVVEEARRLVDAGHLELVLTGIFLGAYGHATALRRRQKDEDHGRLAGVVDALCTRVPGLRRLRLSSLEPGDLTDALLSALSGHEQVARHLHLPLQSGSDDLLRRMNRQYGRDDYLRMIDRVRGAMDRPAITTDIIVGFPGETDAHFQHTLDVVDRAGFIHIHAFPFSPRPGTAAARWTRDFVRGPVVNERLMELRRRASAHSLAFRRQFGGERMEVIVERNRPQSTRKDDEGISPLPGHQHGRCDRYFPIHFAAGESLVGRLAEVTVEQVTPDHTLGRLEGVKP